MKKVFEKMVVLDESLLYQFNNSKELRALLGALILYDPNGQSDEVQIEAKGGDLQATYYLGSKYIKIKVKNRDHVLKIEKWEEGKV